MAPPVAAAGAAAAKAAAAKAGKVAAEAASKAASLAWQQAQRALKRALFNKENVKRLFLLLVGMIGLSMAMVLIVVMIVASAANAVNPLNWFGDKPPASSGVPPEFWPIYSTAAAQYGVNPYLLASIHQQESTFSNPGLAEGWNGCGASGPMQFGVVGVAPYNATVSNCENPAGAGPTWVSHRNAYRAIDEARPAVGAYRLDRRAGEQCRGVRGLQPCALKSCEEVAAATGCVYDTFEAIAAAAHKLKADGADMNLYSAGTKQAVCSYIGECTVVDNCVGGPNDYCGVIPRAQDWQRMGAAELEASRPVMPYGGGGSLAWPTPPEHRDLSSPFGEDRGDHIHAGIDIPLPTGTVIQAAEAGMVGLACHDDAPPCSGYGNFVCVDHRAPPVTTCYAHLDEIAPGIRAGVPVNRGQEIGKGGNTGHSFGAHLHFEVRVGPYDADPIDPLPFLRPSSSDAGRPGEPV